MTTDVVFVFMDLTVKPLKKKKKEKGKLRSGGLGRSPGNINGYYSRLGAQGRLHEDMRYEG